MSKITIYQIFTRLFGNKNTANKFNGSLNENGSGKFNDISTKALKELKRFGISHVWYTGVIEHATQTDYSTEGIPPDYPSIVKGKAGSPYAIRDYYDVAPDLAENVGNRMKEFEQLVKRSHKQDLKVIIDFVPNHLARHYESDAKPKGIIDFGQDDHPQQSFSPQNNFYYIPDTPLAIQGIDNKIGDKSYQEHPAKATGNDVFHAQPSVYDWYETVKLNYGIDHQNHQEKHFYPTPKTWTMMLEVLMYWANKKIDGFRCDMAEMVPLEFWSWAISKVKAKYPDMLFIAEIYNPRLYHDFIHIGGFDYLYDKVDLYDTVREVIQGNVSVNQITHCWQAQEGLAPYMLRFLENHDEQRIASNKFAIDAFKAIPGMVVTATLNTGPVMIYFGQEVGEPAIGEQGFSGTDGRTSIFDYCAVPEHQKWLNEGKFDGGQLEKWQLTLRDWYSKLLNLCKKPAITYGEFYDLQYVNVNNSHYPIHQVYAYFRHSAEEKLLIVANFDQQTEHHIRLKLSDHVMETVGLSTTPLLVGKEIYCNTGIAFQTPVQEAIQQGIPIRILPNQALIFEIKC